jgi:hypothetical protein
LAAGLPQAKATSEYSIPVNGRYSTFTIGLEIPQQPKWAHDVVLNASLAWNQAQNWYTQNFQNGQVYTFLELSSGSVTVSFSVPAAYSGFAVGWTAYTFAPSSKTSITSAQVFLDENVFSAAQEKNSTARQYAFRLALHELGHVLGLGHLLDGNDIMDPRGPSYLSTQQPLISSLDLYAIHTLASGETAPAFIYLPSSIAYSLIDAQTFLTGENSIPTPEFNAWNLAVLTQLALGVSLILIRRRKKR